jgi:hypothetical protein
MSRDICVTHDPPQHNATYHSGAARFIDCQRLVPDPDSSALSLIDAGDEMVQYGPSRRLRGGLRLRLITGDPIRVRSRQSLRRRAAT